MHVSGNPLDFLLVFLAGITLSFTPCVYPLIPVTAGYIGVNAGGSRRRGFVYSLIYTSGIAVTYAGLGLLAALTGKLFGSVSAHPATLSLVGIVIMLFGFSMLTGKAPFFAGAGKSAKAGNGGYASLFVLGLTSGLIASPCVAPALGSILVYIASTRDILYGTSLLLAFAYGLGATLMLVGTFSTVLLHLPRSGRWMILIERSAAFILIAVGAFLVVSGIRRLL